MENSNTKIICSWCNQSADIIWVHGHGQCSVCGINIDECCRGENCLPVFNNDNDTLTTPKNNNNNE